MSIEFIPEPGAEFEARITALLLSELTGAEAASLRQQIEADPQLAALHARLEKTMGLVREAASTPVEPLAASGANAPLKLSEERRQKLLAQFKTIKPKEFERPKRQTSMSVRLLQLAAVIVGMVVLAGLLLPSLAKSKSKSVQSAITSNLRQIEIAKQMWADDNKRSATDTPTMEDLGPYLGAGKEGLKPRQGEKYYLGPVGQSPVAVVAGAKPQVYGIGIDQKAVEQLASTYGERDKLAVGGNLQFRARGNEPDKAYAKTYPQPAAPPQLAQNKRPEIFLPPSGAVQDQITVPQVEENPRSGGTGGGGGLAGDASQRTPLGLRDKSRQLAESQLTPNGNGQQVGTGLPLALDSEGQVFQGQKKPDQFGRRFGGFDSNGGQLKDGSVQQFSSTPLAQNEPRGTEQLSDRAKSEPRSSSVTPLGQPAPSDSSLASEPALSLPPAPVAAPALSFAFNDTNAKIVKGIDTPSGQWSLEVGDSAAPSYKGSSPKTEPRGTDVLTVAPNSAVNSIQLNFATTNGAVDFFDSSANNRKLGYGNARPASPIVVEDKNLNSNVALLTLNAKGKPIVPSEEPMQRRSLVPYYREEHKQLEDLRKKRETFQAFQTGINSQTGRPEVAGLDQLDKQILEKETKLADVRKKTGLTDEQLLGSNQALALDDSYRITKGSAKEQASEVRKQLKEKEDAPLPKPAAPAPIPQPEVFTSTNAFSTFSLNIADVSFKLAQASLEKGVMPEPASIRSEEFINAFDYRDPEAPTGVPIAFAWERARYPFAQNRDLLRFSLKTAASGRAPGRALNIVLLLDNSGSMERADRVRIIREALRVLAAQLQPQDTLSIVTFARTARLFVDGVPGSLAADAVERVSGLTPEGGTNLGEAMKLAYETALRHYLANGINRVVLLTDGAANLGNVNPASLRKSVEAHRKQGVALDCFGIGWEGYNDDLLEVLARNGDGRYGFLNSPEEAANGFAHQLAGALNVAAADVKVQVEFNPRRVTVYRQIGYTKLQLTKEQFRDNSVDAAEIGAAEAGNALYVLQVDANGEGPLATVRVRYRIPGTQDFHEHEWSVPYTGGAVALEQSSPAMRLSATASAFSEWVANSPYAAEVTPDALLHDLSGVPETFAPDARPQKLEWMIRQAKSISGR